MAAAAVVLMVALLAAPAALAAPHVNLLDADGEAAEHRAVTIGSEAKAYRGELKGADSAVRSWRWTAEPQGILRIGDASSQEASISGIAEGSATVTVTATLPDGTELSDSMLLASYTWLPRAYPASVSASGGAVLTRGATGDASRDYVRCAAPAGQALEVVGTCGDGFFRVRLPEDFDFSDPDGHSSNRNAFCRRSALSVPAASVTVSPKSIKGREGDSTRLSAKVEPPFATDRKVFWSSSDLSVAEVDQKGNVTMAKEGACLVIASCGPAKASARVAVTRGPYTEPECWTRTAGTLRLRWAEVEGADSYRVQVFHESGWDGARAGWKNAGRAVRGTSGTVRGYFAKGGSGKTAGVKSRRSYRVRVVPLSGGKEMSPPEHARNNCSAGEFDPTLPWAQSRTSTTVHLRWHEHAGAAGYRVEYRALKTGGRAKPGKWKTASPKAEGTSLKLSNLSGKKGYEFRAVPVDGNGKSIGKEGTKGYAGSVGAYRLEATFINVGHGDSILIRTPDNRFYLVDGGCDTMYKNTKKTTRVSDTYAQTYAAIKRLLGNVPEIEGIISTHPDYDHAEGLLLLFKKRIIATDKSIPINKYRVKRFWYTKDASSTKYEKLVNLAKQLCGKANVFDASTVNREVTVSQKPDLEIRLVHDTTDHSGNEGNLSSANRDSALTLVRYKKFSMLLCGDALGTAIDSSHGAKSVKEAMGDMGLSSVDVLQVPHHGMIGMAVSGATKEKRAAARKKAQKQCRQLMEACKPKRLVLSTETRDRWDVDEAAKDKASGSKAKAAAASGANGAKKATRGKAVNTLGKPMIASAKSKKARKLTVKVAKLKGADGYTVQAFEKKTASRAAAEKDTGSGTANLSGLAPGKTYWVRARAWSKKNGEKAYGKWGPWKKARVNRYAYHDYRDSIDTMFSWLSGYGSPKDVLPAKSTPVYMTGRDGNVTVYSYGKNCSVSRQRTTYHVSKLVRAGKKSAVTSKLGKKRFGKRNRKMKDWEVPVWSKRHKG